MKRYDVYGLGNGMVDIFVELSEEDFAALNLEKGTMRLVEFDEQKELLERFASSDSVLASGGSVANSVIGVTQLGGKAAYACTLGDDRYGLYYKNDFDNLGIEIGNPLIVNEATGTCLAFITPDAERTMRTCLGVASHLSAKHIVEETVAASKWMFVEGYLFSNPENGQEAVKRGVELARKNDCKIAVTVSEAWVVEVFGAPLREAIAQADLVFANESEVQALTGEEDFDTSLKKLGEMVPNYAVTRGAEGSYISFEGVTGRVEAFPCNPVDLTGAGDIFAGAFLYGITHNIEPLHAAKAACYLAKEVIIRTGARLHSGAREYWDECLNA